MATNSVMIKLVLLSISAAYFRRSSADYPNSVIAQSCVGRSDSSTTPGFKTNLNSLLSIFQEEGPRNNGFYKTTVGENSDKIYGLVQCRGDVSAQDCATCIKDSINETLNSCNNSDSGSLWFRWCFLRFSKTNFFGQWGGTTMGLSFANSTVDGPTVVAKGMSLMSQLTAEVPNHPFMFKTGSVSVGQEENRYGLVQCTRDLNKSACGDCLTSVANSFNKGIGNQSTYLVINNGCIMNYDRYKFYFNYTLPTVSPAPSSASGIGLRISFLVVVIAMFLSIFIQTPTI